MVKFGFKEISLENWLQPDSVHSYFVKLSQTGEAFPMLREDWIRPLLKPKLLKTVPQDVQALFEVARGAMVYGYFFYPLWTLGTEQLFRVTEAAVSHKCENLGAPNAKKYFKDKINWLRNEKAISPAEIETLYNIKDLRNFASHPRNQSIITPAIAISLLESIARTINSLFKTKAFT